MLNGNTGSGVIVTDLEAVIAAGSPGDRLPSVRELMARHRAGPATVQRAIAELSARGLVEARPGRGTFVASREVQAAADTSWQTVALGPRAIDAEYLEDLIRPPEAGLFVLSAGYLPPDLQPTAMLGAALARAARRTGAWDRMPSAGLSALRTYFASAVGGGATAGDVLICGGGQAALSGCLRALAAPGAPVLVEAPTYLGALTAARGQGLRPVPVPTDAHGIRPDLLADALQSTGARLVYMQPVFANPHGVTLSLERRADVLAAVRAAGAFLVEDDAFRDVALGPAPPPLFHDDPDGHVVHLRSLTKPSAPGLRICAVVARGPAATRLRDARVVEDLFVSGPLQEAALELVGSPAWRTHLRRLARVLKERRDACADAVTEHLGPLRDAAAAPRAAAALSAASPVVTAASPRAAAGLGAASPRVAGPSRIGALPGGGMNLWVRLDPEEDDRALSRRAAGAGVLVFPGRAFFATEPPAPYIRITYAAETPDRLAEGVRRLAELR